VSIDNRKSKILPEDQNLFYHGNSVFAKLGLDVRGEVQDQNLELGYYFSCPSSKNTRMLFGGGRHDLIKWESITKTDLEKGFKTTNILTIPKVGPQDSQYFYTTFNLGGNANAILAVPTSGNLIGQTNIEFATYLENGVEIPIEDTSIFNGWIEQNFQINGGGSNKNYVVVDNFNDKPWKDKPITLYFKNEPQNVVFYKAKITSENGVNKAEYIGEKVFPKQLNELTAGKCIFKARIVTEQQKRSLSLENFDTFNFANSRDIITDITVAPIYKTEFSITTPKSDTSSPSIYIDILNPVKDQSVGLSQDGISVEFIYQDSSGNVLDKLEKEVSFSLNIEGYGVIASETLTNLKRITTYDSDLKTPEGKNLQAGVFSFTIDNKDNKFDEVIKNLKTRADSQYQGVEGYISGTPSSSLQATLAIQIKNEMNSYGVSPTSKTISKTIPFRIYYKKTENSTTKSNQTKK
jgi:hypothetical protein